MLSGAGCAYYYLASPTPASREELLQGSGVDPSIFRRAHHGVCLARPSLCYSLSMASLSACLLHLFRAANTGVCAKDTK